MKLSTVSSKQTEVKLRVEQQPEEEADTKTKIQQLFCQKLFSEPTVCSSANLGDRERERERERERQRSFYGTIKLSSRREVQYSEF